jgi:hypothetical protein
LNLVRDVFHTLRVERGSHHVRLRGVNMRLASLAWGVGAALALGVGSSALAVPALDSVQAGWTPLVSWWGDGDPTQAVTNLTRLTNAFSTVLHRTEIDAHTQKFMDDSLEQLSDFDLHEFHELLPEQRDGFRELSVRGDLKGSRYSVRRADPAQPFRVSLTGPRRGLADFSQVIRSKLLPREDDEDSYLIGVRFGLGVGRFSWDQTTHAIADFGRIVSNADPRVGAAAQLQGDFVDKPHASPASLALVRSLHPNLAKDDVEPTALLFDAYPSLSRTFSQVGQLEDLRAEDLGAGARHLSVSLHGSPERLAKNHAAFAKHMERMGKIAHIDVRWVDAQSRTLVKWSVDSETLRFGMECYVKDGLLLPWAGKTVFTAEGVEPLSAQLEHTRAFIHARVQMLGVVVDLTNLKANLLYQPHDTYATMSASVNTVPSVHVEGATAGIIDVLIPGNIQSLTQGFFRRAAYGNAKQGIAIKAVAGSENRATDGVLEGSFDLEALDSRLVKMGVGMVNDRLMPNSEVFADAKKFLGEMHDAFMSDLSRYKGRLGS